MATTGGTDPADPGAPGAPPEPGGAGEHLAINASYWAGRAGQYAERARALWTADEPVWGIWDLPQSVLPLLPDDVAGLDVVELGCGTGYVSAWLARRGARPVGVDLSAEQLATARALQEELGPTFPLHQGNAEELPFDDASFDLAVSEYGAVTWCDPYRWIPEAARVLRPGGRLVFLRNATMLMLCEPQEGHASDRLLRPWFGLDRMEWHDPEGTAVNFQLPYGAMIRLLRAHGLVVDDLVEVRPPAGATTTYPYVTLDWARRWPTEEVWFVRRER
jgi:SAM-dependent methyltransferase